MRKLLVVSCLLAACGGAKDAKTDGGAGAATPLKAADLAGSFEGVMMGETSDSVLISFTATTTANAAGGLDGKIWNHAVMKDTSPETGTVSGDSATFTSAPYIDATMPKGSPQVRFKSIGPAVGHNWSGTTVIMVAANDSVVMRGRWKGTHTPP